MSWRNDQQLGGKLIYSRNAFILCQHSVCYCTRCLVELHASIPMDEFAPKMNMFKKSKNKQTKQKKI